MGTWAYRTAPSFWHRFAEDLQRDVLPAPGRPNPRAWGDHGIYAAWVGHATVLLKIDGATILTDPVLGTRVGLNLGPFTLGLKRLVEPALVRRDLPKIDLVLLSHAHMDHFDLPTLRSLENRGTELITAPKTSDLLRTRQWKRVRELRWDERARVGPIEVRAFEVKHWGARMRSDTYRGYTGYSIDVGRYRVLFGGDTAVTPLFRNLKSHRPYDLAVMPIGAYNPWIHYHCTPEQAWRMTNDAGAELVVPIHHQTFQLSREPYLEPLERLHEAAGNAAGRIVVKRIGQEFHIA
jgi:L-ascorbate metabolism protein UlaG (beta-lactamase superfamily)